MAADTIDIDWGTPAGDSILLSHEGPFRVSSITGWEDLPPARVDDVARSNAHGSHDAAVWSGARTVVVEGYCIDTVERDALLAELGASARLGGSAAPGTLAVTLAGRQLSATARLLRAGTTLRNWGVGHFGWQIEWWCPDPLRYSPQVSTSTGMPSDSGGLVFPLFDVTSSLDFGGAVNSSGIVVLDNPGTAESWPRLFVTGPVPGGFELVELTTGRRIRWELDVADGLTVALDSRTGAVSYGDSPGYDGELTAAQWWSVPPGGSRTVQINPIGTPDPGATLEVAWAPAYW